MPGAHERQHPTRRPRRAATSSSVAQRPLTAADGILMLQRLAGNAATRRVLARDEARTPPAPAPTFRLILADDGATGLTGAIVNVAVTNVRKEITRITKTSREGAVKAGIDVVHVASKPVRNDDFTHELGRTTFLIFLTQGKDAKHSVDLAADYTPMAPDVRKRREENFKKNIIAEGGVDLQTTDRRRGSQSVGFVGSEWPLKELKKRGGGTESAGNVLGDVILHELGHALGHNDVIGSMDHDKTGIMTAKIVLDQGPYQAQQYSTASAQVIRGRLEELAGKLKPTRP